MSLKSPVYSPHHIRGSVNIPQLFTSTLVNNIAHHSYLHFREYLLSGLFYFYKLFSIFILLIRSDEHRKKSCAQVRRPSRDCYRKKERCRMHWSASRNKTNCWPKELVQSDKQVNSLLYLTLFSLSLCGWWKVFALLCLVILRFTNTVLWQEKY